MMNFHAELVQNLCICGILYGAYLSITYRPDEEISSTRVNFDPLTMHTLEDRKATLEKRIRSTSTERDLSRPVLPDWHDDPAAQRHVPG